VVQTGSSVAVAVSEDVQIFTSGEEVETISVFASSNSEVSFLLFVKDVNKKAECSEEMLENFSSP
jgi:hypothetical protein